MLKRVLIIFFLAIAASPALAAGEPIRDRILQALRDDGYSKVTISRTFLGRMRFVATKPDARREIVVNPVNGVILRDYIRFLRNSDGSSQLAPPVGSESSNDYDDDEYDDDYDDESDDESEDEKEDDEEDEKDEEDDKDDDNVDNSGSGSSNSGSGSG